MIDGPFLARIVVRDFFLAPDSAGVRVVDVLGLVALAVLWFVLR